MTTMDIRELKERIATHRAKVMITCDEDCPCWDVERLLEEIEREKKGGD